MHPTMPLLARSDFPALRRRRAETLQVNLGYKCNQSCLHCHVNAGPNRTEMMDGETVDLVLEVLEHGDFRTLDLTGGAPELNGHFRRLAASARDLGLHVIDRCNLTVLFEPGQEDLAGFLAGHRIDVVASLPCHSVERVAGNLETVMCRSLISVDWQGYLYDCDFNQMLGLPMRLKGRSRAHLRDLMGNDPDGEVIRVADHCYGCTAGQGSSCGGALDA